MPKPPMPIRFEHRYASLNLDMGAHFGSHITPNPLTNPRLIALNKPLAKSLHLDVDFFRSNDGVLMLAGNQFPPHTKPFAQVYAGHQFGHWNPQLGDGRAVLIGEICNGAGRRFDIQLKGSGQTPYSRGGDGRAPLGAVLREYLVSEAMHALGVPTTRSLGMIVSDDIVYRERTEPAAVLTRVASSHIRVGTFQYFASIGDYQSVQTLADFAIERHYPEIADADNPYIALLAMVIKRQALLIAQWQSFGFIHGVMNTDNMLIGSETIDFGPCAFIEAYHPSTVFSSIDVSGRYAYDQQPSIGKWNLTRFAECLLPLFARGDSDAAIKIAKAELQKFDPAFNEAHQARMQAKIGIDVPSVDGAKLVGRLLKIMMEAQLDFSLWFRMLGEHLPKTSNNPPNDALLAAYPLPDTLRDWQSDWQTFLDGKTAHAKKIMQQANPIFFPRNHQIAQAIDAAQTNNDFTPFHRLIKLYKNPFDFDPAQTEFVHPATDDEKVIQTFCGT